MKLDKIDILIGIFINFIYKKKYFLQKNIWHVEKFSSNISVSYLNY